MTSTTTYSSEKLTGCANFGFLFYDKTQSLFSQYGSNGKIVRFCESSTKQAHTKTKKVKQKTLKSQANSLGLIASPTTGQN